MTARRLTLGCAVLGALLLLAAGVVAFGPAGRPAADGVVATPAPLGTVPAGTRGAASTARAPADTARPPERGARLRSARLHLDAPVVPVRLVGRVLQVPRDPARVGWWRAGAVPGAARGSAVIVGHVNYAGTDGAFAVLPAARPGERITLTRPRAEFRVVAVRSYPKVSGIPQSAFSATGPPQLVLITCGGDFDRSTGNYEDNVVVYAVRA